MNADTDGDGMPDSWEIANNLVPIDPDDSDLDLDGDGDTNLEEYLCGADPSDSTSNCASPTASAPFAPVPYICGTTNSFGLFNAQALQQSGSIPGKVATTTILVTPMPGSPERCGYSYWLAKDINLTPYMVDDNVAVNDQNAPQTGSYSCGSGSYGQSIDVAYTTGGAAIHDVTGFMNSSISAQVFDIWDRYYCAYGWTDIRLVVVPPQGKQHCLRFGKYSTATVTDYQIDGWCIIAGEALQKKDFSNDICCCATFKRIGPMGSSNFPQDGIVDDDNVVATWNAAHNANFDVYYVKGFSFLTANNVVGYSRDTPDKVSLIEDITTAPPGLLLAHEWGHALGLYPAGSHDPNAPLYIMNGTITVSCLGVTAAECNVYRQ